MFGNTEFAQKLANNELRISVGKRLPNTEEVIPFVFLGDEIFALQHHFMKPFQRTYTGVQHKIFNYRLSRARMSIERAFGLLVSKWRIFKSLIAFYLEHIDSIIGACICLHNFLLSSNAAENIENQDIANDIEEYDRRMLPAQIRLKFSEYFLSPYGAVPWQNNYIWYCIKSRY